MKKINLTILGGSSICRERLVQVTSCLSTIEKSMVVETLKEAVAILKEHHIDVLVIMLDHADDLNVIRQAKACNPDIKIMVLSSGVGKQNIVNIIQLGISAFLTLQDALNNIAIHLEEMLRGDFPISPSIAKYALKTDRSEPAENIEALFVLSPRELDVLQIMALGHSRSMIAESLNLSPHTVTTHIKHIYKKLGVHTRTEAFFIAQKKGLLRVGD
ncbi:MAG: response regulator transcription factor [Mariprofundaceae bacterium]|nr:response regulator transcription factor [Mariprofundaceae bacterium]